MPGQNMEDILSRCLRDRQYRRKVNEKINEMVKLIDAGHALEDSPLADLARSRIRVRKKYDLWDRIFMDSYSAQYSTPEIIARYRAGRIDEDVLDIGSGSGMQCIMFGLRSGCTGIEREKIRYISAMINAEVYGSKSRFRNEDFYEATFGSADLVFSDPLRMNTRNVRDLIPSPYDIMEKIKADAYVFDLPPHADLRTIEFSGEKEYISVGGVLSRFTVYIGRHAESDFSAHILPAGIHLTGSRYTGGFAEPRIYDYIYVLDPAVSEAGLFEDFSDMALISKDERRTVLSHASFRRNFPGSVFSVYGIYDWPGLEAEIASVRPNKVYLRYSIPSDQYYEVTRRLEQRNGSGDVYVFRFSDRYVLANKIYDVNYNNISNL
ncbi:MAG: SAM-dependent methyltransferase [Thermoplasma sp.]|nr:MAG: SAM-dependent methyltransferase [Thermoplasma sp.]